MTIVFNIKSLKIDKYTTTKATTLSFEKCYHKSTTNIMELKNNDLNKFHNVHIKHCQR